MKLIDYQNHFYNGNDLIYSARQEGKEERILFRNGIQFTEKQAKLYKRINNPLPKCSIR
jgi:hypothetical protein